MGKMAHTKNNHQEGVRTDPEKRMCDMNRLKQKIQFWAVILLLVSIGFTVWYLFFAFPGQGGMQDSTLVLYQLEGMVSV